MDREAKTDAVERKNYLTMAEQLGLKAESLGMDWWLPNNVFRDYTMGLQKKGKTVAVVIRSGLKEYLVPVERTKQ